MNMTKLIKSVLFVALLFSLFSTSAIALAQNSIDLFLPEIHFFYSDTCPHCHDEMVFFEKLKANYPSLKINEYNMASRGTPDALKNFAEKANLDKQYLGLVPMTFINDSVIVGFNTEATTGKNIERLLTKDVTGAETITELEVCEDSDEVCDIDIDSLTGGVIDDSNYTTLNQVSNLGKFGINASTLSLPVLSIVLGFFDGFNVCSLGALLLILSLVLVLKSRKKILLFGGLFLIVTGLTYSMLVFLWFALFQLLAPYITFLEIFIGLMGVIGGIWFFRQWLQYRKYGPTCESNNSQWIQKMTKKVQGAFSGNKSVWVVSIAIILFSFVVTIIEFPCSAVIPVAFAAILTSAGTGVMMKGLYLAIFMFFYLLDELIVFLIGLFTLKIWFGGQKMTKNLALVQAIVFIVLGIFYLRRLF